MSGVVLDTHTLVWLMAGNRKLGSRSRRLIDGAIDDSEVLISAISIWEIAVLLRKGRLTLDRSLAEWRRQVRELGVVEMPVTGDIAAASTELDDFPADPADRIIGATAISAGSVLVTADHEILEVKDRPAMHDATV